MVPRARVGLECTLRFPGQILNEGLSWNLARRKNPPTLLGSPQKPHGLQVRGSEDLKERIWGAAEERFSREEGGLGGGRAPGKGLCCHRF